MTHYFDKEQHSPLREEQIKVRIFNKVFTFFSASGLFSRAHLDIATRLLIEKCDLKENDEVLDLGCGWGAVAILITKRYKNLIVTASDVNTRAVKYTKKNARLHHLSITVKQSNLFEHLPEKYTCILTNPPYVAGRTVCFSFIEESYAHLVAKGNLQLVARHNKGGKVLFEHMKEIFGNGITIAKQSGFRIYKSVKE